MGRLSGTSTLLPGTVVSCQSFRRDISKQVRLWVDSLVGGHDVAAFPNPLSGEPSMTAPSRMSRVILTALCDHSCTLDCCTLRKGV